MGRVRRPHRLLRPEMFSLQAHVDRGHIVHDDFRFILDAEGSLKVYLGDVRAEGFDVEELVRRHAVEQALPLLGIGRQKLGQGADLAPLGGALPHILLVDVRNLQQMRTSDVDGLDQAPPEIDHGLRASEPLAHAGDLDHRLGHLHGVPQQRVAVAFELGGHQVVSPLHVGPDQVLILGHHREREGPLLVLDDVPAEELDLLVVRRPRRDVPALGAGGQELGAGLGPRSLEDVEA
mmetsp:Transcript_96921/g.278405  ORF Transcript_96921/g.278405 Transcript_96921/m.278405 type:complete len:235 (+) Transcript_96921:643-1347(+)